MNMILGDIISFLMGAFALYVTGYMKERGKNRALLIDLNRLETEKQDINAKYQTQIERLKKDHMLDIEKRKFRYEDKRAQFSKFFSLLDDFNKTSNEIIGARFELIFQKFFSDYLRDELSDKNACIVAFGQEMQLLFADIYKEQKIMRNETNGIRLISSQAIDILLDNLDRKIEQSITDTVEMLRFMGTPTYIANKNLIGPYSDKVRVSSDDLIGCKNELRKQMKLELEDI